MVIRAVVDLRARRQTQEELAERASLLTRRNEEFVDLVTTDALTSLSVRRLRAGTGSPMPRI